MFKSLLDFLSLQLVLIPGPQILEFLMCLFRIVSLLDPLRVPVLVDLIFLASFFTVFLVCTACAAHSLSFEVLGNALVVLFFRDKVVCINNFVVRSGIVETALALRVDEAKLLHFCFVEVASFFHLFQLFLTILVVTLRNGD